MITFLIIFSIILLAFSVIANLLFFRCVRKLLEERTRLQRRVKELRSKASCTDIKYETLLSGKVVTVKKASGAWGCAIIVCRNSASRLF